MKSFIDLFRVNGKSHAMTFALVSSLFFLWGFCNGMIDVLNKHFQNSLHVSKAASGFVQFANFIGYFVMAIPSGLLARRFGYKIGIVIGLALIAGGALWFIPATAIGTFAGFLCGLFILAAGLAVLETIANPYTTVLGPPSSGAARINIAQTCNALGTLVGPLVAGTFILSSTGHANTSNAGLYIPYLFIAALVLVLMLLFWKAELPDLQAQDDAAAAGTKAPGAVASKPLLGRWHFTLAIGAQFFYVAAQIGVWAYFINYMTSPDMPDLPAWMSQALPAGWSFEVAGGVRRLTDLGASKAFAGGILCFLAGRIVGSMILRVSSAHRTLAVFGFANVILMSLIIARLGWISVAALFLCNFFMSIMFPTIFALGIRGLGAHTKLASSLIVMAIVGGAVMPLAMGRLADVFSMRAAFCVPLLCFIYIAIYAAIWPRLEVFDSGHSLPDSPTAA
jgi:MFS transporter, FHS family, L-fucose permease